MKKTNKEFWVTNLSNRDVSLADLNLTIKAFTSVNLLGKKYNYTLEQLEKSVASGSIFRKRDKIVKRTFPPEFIKMNIVNMSDANIPSRERSVLEIKEEKYEELMVSDEEFAKENADLIDLDQ
jgi:hypothetical protein